MRGVFPIAIAIAIAIGGAACTNADKVTFAIGLQIDRASTEIQINGVTVDGGGAVPRTLTVMYEFDDWTMARNAHYLLQAFAGGGKIGELTVTPNGCAGVTETQVLDLHTDGSFTLADDRCM